MKKRSDAKDNGVTGIQFQGATAFRSRARLISADDVKKFTVVGDSDPIHLDEGFAENSYLKKRSSMARSRGLDLESAGYGFPQRRSIPSIKLVVQTRFLLIRL
ncbi:MAG: hypothetical protein U0X87_12130 [Anaerolineales bacterium]